jgi:hypothetical protein
MMKRRYVSCDRCSELIYDDNYSNQQFDNLCTYCHSTAYDTCIECESCILDDDDGEDLRCRALVHCTCDFCSSHTKRYMTCLGCREDVVKERDDLTFAIIDVCYTCLMTRCLGCYQSETMVCNLCITTNTTYRILLLKIKTVDIAKTIMSYILPSRHVVIGHPNHCNISGKDLLQLALEEV